MVLDIVMFFELLRFLWTLLNEYRMKLRKDVLLTLCIYFGIYQPDFAPIRNGLNRTFPKIYQSLNNPRRGFKFFSNSCGLTLGLPSYCTQNSQFYDQLKTNLSFILFIYWRKRKKASMQFISIYFYFFFQCNPKGSIQIFTN